MVEINDGDLVEMDTAERVAYLIAHGLSPKEIFGYIDSEDLVVLVRKYQAGELPVSDDDVIKTERILDLIQSLDPEGKKKELLQEALDEMVHELKAGEAASINNEGIEGQLDYLLTEMGEDHVAEEVRKTLERKS